MAQSGFTPIQLFRTTTAAAVPTAGNLAAGELAINLTDERLYFKNAAGVVKLLASNSGSLGTVTSVDVSGGTTGLTTSGGPITSSGTITLAGTLGVANGGTGTTTAFTAGSVVFAGASGVYSQDNANFFWDNSNDRLGIGTVTPPATLSAVSSSNGSIMFLRRGGGTYNPGLYVNLSDTINNEIIFNTTYSTGNAPSYVWQNADAEIMRLNNTGLGIGTASLLAKLHVAANATYQQYLTGTDINQQLRLGYDTTNNVGKIQAVQVGVGFKDLVLQPEGNNVGIGVTPSAWSGGFRAVQFSGGNSFYSQGGQASLGSNAYNDSGWKYVGTGTAGLFTNVAGEFAWFNAASGTAGNAITFTQAMTLDASGRLGIGTAAAPLVSKVVIEGTNANVASQIQIVGTGVLSGYIGPSADGLNFGTDSGGLLFRTGVTGNASVTTGTERMRIDSSGNLLVGTTSAVQKITVFGNLSGNNAANCGIAILRSGTTFGSNLYHTYSTTTGSDAFGLTVNDNTTLTDALYTKYLVGSNGVHVWYGATNAAERMRIDSSGRLFLNSTTGVGNEQMFVGFNSSGSITQAINLRDNNASGNGNSFIVLRRSDDTYLGAIGRSGTDSAMFVEGNSYLTLRTGATERMRIDSAGDVGIGTSSPISGYKLTMEGNGAYAALRCVTSAGFSALSGFDGATQRWSVGQLGFGGVNGLGFYVGSGTEVGRFDASGNLLVGTTTVSFTDSNSVAISPSTYSGQINVQHATGSGSGNGYLVFTYAANQIGSISQSGTTAVLFNTTSDARLKKNVANADDAASLIDALQVRKFDWKADGTHQRYGFVAQELVEVAPEAVHQPADPEDMMGVDYSKLVPMLVKEIQSLRARVAQLEGS
jgi:hypothetical protein